MIYYILVPPFELLGFQMNRTHTGFKRILVGEGITVEVRGAREVAAFQASDLGSTVNRSNVAVNERSEFWPFWHAFCRPLVQIQVFEFRFW